MNFFKLTLPWQILTLLGIVGQWTVSITWGSVTTIGYITLAVLEYISRGNATWSVICSWLFAATNFMVTITGTYFVTDTLLPIPTLINLIGTSIFLVAMDGVQRYKNPDDDLI